MLLSGQLTVDARCTLVIHQSVNLYVYQAKPIAIKPENNNKKQQENRTSRPNYL